MRLIDADALEPHGQFKALGNENHEYVEVVYMDDIRDAPTIESEQRWIPVAERLPEKNGVYIVSYEDAVTWLEWFNGKWFFIRQIQQEKKQELLLHGCHFQNHIEVNYDSNIYYRFYLWSNNNDDICMCKGMVSMREK